jgi:hypothetical protein
MRRGRATQFWIDFRLSHVPAVSVSIRNRWRVGKFSTPGTKNRSGATSGEGLGATSRQERRIGRFSDSSAPSSRPRHTAGRVLDLAPRTRALWAKSEIVPATSIAWKRRPPAPPRAQAEANCRCRKDEGPDARAPGPCSCWWAAQGSNLRPTNQQHRPLVHMCVDASQCRVLTLGG